MKRLHVSLIALAAALPAPVLAQSASGDAFALDEIVVTANRVETDRNRTGASVSVINSEDLGAVREVGIAGAFRNLAGVSVTEQGPFGSPVSVRIRGADQRYLAVFIDGVRVADPSGVQTQFDFGMLPSIGVDRIEILRGSQSALWGGSAVGGVVNMTSTARPTEEGTQQMIQAEAGSFGTASLRYSLAQKVGNFETALSLSHLRSDGFSAAAVGSERDPANATRLSATVRYHVSDALTVGGTVFTQRSNSEFDGFVDTNNDGFTDQFGDLPNEKQVMETGLRAFTEFSLGNTEHIVDVTRYEIKRDINDENGSRLFNGNRVAASWQATTSVADALQLVYGAEVMKENASYPTLSGGAADTTIAGAFGQALWQASTQLDVSATLRVDDHSEFGRFETGRLAVAWRPTRTTTLRFAAATGFRAPSIDELFGDYPSQQFVGFSGLAPEESESFELGIEHSLAGGAIVSATAFRLNIENLIVYSACPANNPAAFDFSCAPGTVNTLENVSGQSVRKGVELTADLPLSDTVRLGVAYTYTDARRPDGKRIGLVPFHELSATLSAAVDESLTAGLGVKHVSGKLNDFASARMDNYTTVKATLDYDLGQGRNAYVRVENLFDTDYQTSNGYSASGRAVFAGLRASF